MLSIASGLPAEILEQIFQSIYEDLQPQPSLDSRLELLTYTSRPSNAHVFARPLRDEATLTFHRICLVCKSWGLVAQQFLFRDIRVEVPRQWESLLAVIAEPDEVAEEEERHGRSTQIHATRGGRLVSPPQSRSRSRSRSRARSPIRAGLGSPSIETAMRGVSLERSISEDRDPRINHLGDHLPGLHIESISFSAFRTVGMRRTIREGSQHRFVTLDRVLRLLQGTRSVGVLSTEGGLLDPYLEPDEDPSDERGRLKAVGMTEYMDSALHREVLDELLLRGGVGLQTADGLMLAGSSAALAACPLVALDLCGCVSGRFIEGLGAFIEANKIGQADGYSLPHLRRLGLHSVLVASNLLEAFVGAFPQLTHLDLTNTRATPSLLQALSGKAPVMQLRSLSLARCKSLTSASIRDFLVGAETLDGGKKCAASHLSELSLYGDEATASPLSEPDLVDIFGAAPCFVEGRLRYLDLGSVPGGAGTFAALPLQSQLVDLSLANKWNELSLRDVTAILRKQTPNVQVLDLTNTCLANTRNARVDVMELHAQLLSSSSELPNLRVIGLDDNTLKAIAGGAGSWKVIYGKGTRGFYVQTAARGPEAQAALKEILRDERLTPADFGWHPRKMEILLGHGFFGREDAGLYAFHAHSLMGARPSKNPTTQR